MIKCNYCGAMLKDTAVFCRYCGQRTTQKSEIDTSQLTAEQFYVMSEKIKSTISDLTQAYAKGITEKNVQFEALKEKTDLENAQLCSSLEKMRAEFEDMKKEKAAMDRLVATLAAEKQGLMAELQKMKAVQDEAESQAAAALAATEKLDVEPDVQEPVIAQETVVESQPEEPQEIKEEKPAEKSAEEPMGKKRRKAAPKQAKNQKEAVSETSLSALELAPETDAVSAAQSGKCPKCGAATDSEMAFCTGCGEPLR
ncbi:MAG: zinc ribbon domain-containing protein [Ruthenibacterium sp.]